MTIIEDVIIRRISNSRGNETIEVDVRTKNGFGRAAAPSGASKGAFEARTLPVPEAISKAKENVIPRLIGLDAAEQNDVDALLHEIDGTADFSNIGGNVAIAVSMAVAKAAASSHGVPLYRYLGLGQNLPYPLGNVIGGGAHAPGGTDIQEFLVLPTGARSMTDAVFANASVHKQVKMLLDEKGIPCGKGDEGAWAPKISNEEALMVISEAIVNVVDHMGFEIRAALDVAATVLWNGSAYIYSDVHRSREEQMHYIEELIDRYDLYYVEDPLHEQDFDGFAKLTSGASCLICGDDLFATDASRIKRGIEIGAANSVLIKPNQVGTVTDAYNTVKIANANGYICVMSHRSGETPDETIAHLAVAFGTPIIKTGIAGGERIAKLNELIRMEELGGKMAELA
ncbi:MAG: phosphopyruvate hydratase [Methanocellales archaeon]|nr:phosphopyruvate hydratase [Methanocellales archaeon]